MRRARQPIRTSVTLALAVATFATASCSTTHDHAKSAAKMQGTQVTVAAPASARSMVVAPTGHDGDQQDPRASSGVAAPSNSQTAAPAPEAPAPPAYDLAKDLAARAAYAKEKLGRGTVTTVVGRYVVVAPPGWGSQELSTSVSLMQNAMNAFYTGRFEKKPERAITVYLFPRAQPYDAFCKSEFNESPCMSIYGFYQPNGRAMVMNAGLGLGTLTHELVHPLVEADFYDAPTWLNEGIASVFEAPVIPRVGEIHGVKNWRYPILRAAMKAAPDSMRLSQLFRISDDEFRGANESRNYALARYVCQWLDGKNKLWEFYHEYRDHYATDPKGTASFAKVMQQTPEEMDATFDRWVKAL